MASFYRKKRKSRKATTIIVSLAVFAAAFLLFIYSLKIPDFETLAERKVIQSTKIYDRTGTILLYDIHEDIKRTVIPFAEIPRHIKNATVAIEDDNFYSHPGIDPISIMRALITDILSGKKKQGGSTITQQLVKNAFLTSEKTFIRKIKEAVLAVKMERYYSKDKILELYLNEIPYGSSSYGIESAAQTFFAKSAKDLTLAESAYLVSLPQASTYYSPYGSHMDELEKRKNLVVERMSELGFMTEQEKNAALKERVVFVRKEDTSIKAPHFVMMVREYLNGKYGENVVSRGGLKVVTTLDWSLQNKAEDIVLQYATENATKFNAKNAGLVAADPKTGQILVMVGSKDYFDEEIDGNYNVTLARRQPGSAFKPFAYATAFEKGFTPETALFDLPTEFNSSCDPDVEQTEKKTAAALKADPDYKDECYHPTNYDGIFRGPISMRDALAQSINIPAIKTLYLAGLNETLKNARDMGITTLDDSSRYGLTLVLGGGEVRLADMVEAYGVFANNGVKVEQSFILKVEDPSGKALEEYAEKKEEVLDTQAAKLINSVLSDNKARAPAFGESSYLYFPEREVAAKTGTTNDYRDAWIIGYTPNIVLGAWAGNNDNSPMEKRVAGFIVAPMWNAFMKELFAGLPPEQFTKPEPYAASKPVLRGEWRGGVAYLIDSISGKMATDFTPEDLIKEKVLTDVHTILYWLDKNNPLGPAPSNPSSDPQFNLWEFAVRKWTDSNNIKTEFAADMPRDFDNVHKPEYIPRISLVYPENGLVQDKTAFAVKVDVSGYFNVTQVDFLLDGKFLGTRKEKPYSITYDLSQFETMSDKPILSIKAYDSVGNSGMFEQILYIN